MGLLEPAKAIFGAMMLSWDVAEVGTGLFATSFSDAQGLHREAERL